MAHPIYEYLDYREFLKSAVPEYKSREGLSERSLAKRAGFGSESYIRMALAGKRTLSLKAIEKLGDLLGLKTREIEYLRLIYRFGESKSLLEKDAAYQEILGFGAKRKIQILGEDQYTIFSNWYYPIILEGIGQGFEKMKPTHLAQKLNIEEDEARQALAKLEEAQLIERKNGIYIRTAAGFDSPDSIQGLAVRRLYREMIFRQLEALDTLEKSDREFGLITISLSAKGFERLRKELVEFRKRINALFIDEKNVDGIFQINLGMFRVVSMASKDAEKNHDE